MATSDLTFSVIKVLSLSAISFAVAFFFAPILARFLYRYRLWRKEVREKTPGGYEATIFRTLHAEKEIGTPRMGGLLIWGAVFITAGLFRFLDEFSNQQIIEKLEFVSRNQTWLPLATLAAGSLVGLADDLLQVLGRDKVAQGGLSFARRILLVALIGLAGGWWFHARLGFDTIHVPFGAYYADLMPFLDVYGNIFVGWLAIPIFAVVMLAVFSGGVMDGLDGLAGGVFATMFGAFGLIALFENQIDIAAFCGVIAGATLAFLWFNIPPAKFYMGETGVMGLTAALTVVAFLTDSVWVLPVIAFVLVIESGSVIIQLASKKFRHGKKVFLIAPLHHHFEAKGVPAHAVTMRFWVISAIAATIGVAIRLIG